MGRKTSSVKTSAPVARHMRYADWPECLHRYKWIVDDAAKYRDPERLLNVNRSTLDRSWDAICKVCGDGIMRRDYAKHLSDHVEDLKLSPADLARRYPKPGAKSEPVEVPVALEEVVSVYLDDVLATVYDAVDGRDEGDLQFDLYVKELSTELASVIVVHVTADDGADPVFCADCE